MDVNILVVPGQQRGSGDERESLNYPINNPEVSVYIFTRGISLNDKGPACCRGGVGFESGPHRVILKIIRYLGP